MRILLHFLVLAPVMTVTVIELVAAIDGFGGRPPAVLILGYGFTSLLGLVAMAVLSVQLTRSRVSALFFGATVSLILTSMFAELFVTGWSHWTGDDPRECALMLMMLILGGVGLRMELVLPHK